MRAVAILERGTVGLVDVERPTPGPGEVAVDMLAVGLCGTDLTLARGRRGVPRRPWVLGHEGVGRVVEVGEGVVDRWVGQVVVLEPNLPDLTCATCRAGRSSACPHRRSAGVLTQPGFMSERVVHPARFSHPAPGGARVEDLVCVEPMAVAAAAVRRSGVRRGGRVLVLGAGAQGLLATQVLRAIDVDVHVTDLADARVARAEREGARRAAAHDDPFDVVVDTTGSARAVPDALPLVADGATVVVVGESSEPIALSSQQLVHRQLRLVGSFIYDHPTDFAGVLADVGAGRTRPHRILRDPVSLAQAVDLLNAPDHSAGKAWIDLR